MKRRITWPITGAGRGREDAETVAESVAFVLLNHYGIDASGYSFAYVAGWAQDRAVVKRNLDAIQRTSHVLIAGIEGGDAMENEQSMTDDERRGIRSNLQVS